jgi:type IV pilus assembly protein PilW
LCGYNNKVVQLADIRSQDVPTGTTGALSGGYYTDTLVAQFQGRSVVLASIVNPKSGDLSATAADGSMIDCGGNAIPSSTLVPPARAMSVINIAINSVTSEPELSCSFFTAGGAASPSWPLIKGVESFQVMYEVGDDTSDTKKPRGTPDKFQWLRADQVETFAFTQPPPKDVPKEVFAWQNVVAVRFGMVIRSELNSAPPSAATVSPPLYPLGSDLASASDPGTIFIPPADTRLRRVLTFTTHIRNPLATFRLTPPPPTP